MKLDINGKTFEVKDEDITSALEKKESIKIESDLIMRTPDEEVSFKENITKDGNAASFEIARKGLLKGLGIEVDGQHKNDESAIKAINTFVTGKVTTALTDAKIEPDKKVQELQGDLDKLIQSRATLQGDFDTFKDTAKATEQGHTRRNTLMSLIPDNTLNDKKTTLLILDAQLNTSFNDNGALVGLDATGGIMKDPTTMSPLDIKAVVGKFFDDNTHLLKTASGGAGGGDSGSGGGKTSLETFTKEQKAAGNAENSPAFVAAMTAAAKAGTLILE